MSAVYGTGVDEVYTGYEYEEGKEAEGGGGSGLAAGYDCACDVLE